MPEPMIPPDVTIYKALEAWELRASDAVDLTAQEMDDLVATVRHLLAAAQDGARAERDRLLLAVRRDHMADNDCVMAPCAWCDDLIAILPDAQMPPPEAGPR